MGMRAPLPLTQRPQVAWCGTELTRLATSEREILCFKLLRSHNGIDIMVRKLPYLEFGSCSANPVIIIGGPLALLDFACFGTQ